MTEKIIHQGRNIKRFREMLGIKQEALAYELGEDWNQKKISLLEQKELIENNILAQVAKILKVPVEAIINPLDKMVELYERMLEQQKEMIEKLEKLIK